MCTLRSCSTPIQSNTTITPASTVEFSSAVSIASSVSIQLAQYTSIPAIPLPTNISNHDLLKQLAALMPPLQISTSGADTAAVLAAVDEIKEETKDDPSPADKRLGGRQAGMRIMIVGDSMSQGAQGDWTWRYWIWEWFRDQGISIDFVGPYVGTVEPDLPSAPSPPALYGAVQMTGPVKSNGGYAVGVSTDFDSDHFAVWGRAAAVDKGLIQG